uniref:Vacuolar protein sorting-associated protein 33 like n=1 Tax=Rhizophora mucronata TaxID=61149 RepID=A0A2P2LXN3_RHIMU
MFDANARTNIYTMNHNFFGEKHEVRSFTVKKLSTFEISEASETCSELLSLLVQTTRALHNLLY